MFLLTTCKHFRYNKVESHIFKETFFYVKCQPTNKDLKTKNTKVVEKMVTQALGLAIDSLKTNLSPVQWQSGATVLHGVVYFVGWSINIKHGYQVLVLSRGGSGEIEIKVHSFQLSWNWDWAWQYLVHFSSSLWLNSDTD